jgi:hypothetical protein
MLTHDLDGAGDAVGKGAEAECGGDAVFEEDVHHLVVAHIVVAAVYAPSIRPFLDSF